MKEFRAVKGFSPLYLTTLVMLLCLLKLTAVLTEVVRMTTLVEQATLLFEMVYAKYCCLDYVVD